MSALFSELAGPILGLPWLSATLPWWPLGAPIKDAGRRGSLRKAAANERFRKGDVL